MGRVRFGRKEASLTQEDSKITRSFRESYRLTNLAYFTRASFKTGNSTEREN